MCTITFLLCCAFLHVFSQTFRNNCHSIYDSYSLEDENIPSVSILNEDDSNIEEFFGNDESITSSLPRNQRIHSKRKKSILSSRSTPLRADKGVQTSGCYSPIQSPSKVARRASVVEASPELHCTRERTPISNWMEDLRVRSSDLFWLFL